MYSSRSVYYGNAVFFQQGINTFTLGIQYFGLVLHKGRHADFRIAAWVNSELRGIFCLCKNITGMLHYFGGNTAPIQAGAAEVLFFDEGYFRAELCGSHCCCISARAAAYDSDFHYRTCLVFLPFKYTVILVKIVPV